MPKFTFENLLKISFPLLIVLALLRLTAYYYYFDVPIVDYLEITEIVTLFLDHIVLYLFLFFIPLLPSVDSRNSKPVSIIITCFMIIWVVISLINKTGDYFKASLILYVVPIGALFLAHKLYSGSKWVVAMGGYFYMLMAISIIGRMEAVAVENKHYYSETEVTVDNVVIKTDSSFYYLGKTSNYVFFYDVKNKGAVIYPCGKMNKVVMRSKTPENCAPVFP